MLKAGAITSEGPGVDTYDLEIMNNTIVLTKHV